MRGNDLCGAPAKVRSQKEQRVIEMCSLCLVRVCTSICDCVSVCSSVELAFFFVVKAEDDFYSSFSDARDGVWTHSLRVRLHHFSALKNH